jgi:hypothetical protein
MVSNSPSPASDHHEPNNSQTPPPTTAPSIPTADREMWLAALHNTPHGKPPVAGATQQPLPGPFHSFAIDQTGMQFAVAGNFSWPSVALLPVDDATVPQEWDIGFPLA